MNALKIAQRQVDNLCNTYGDLAGLEEEKRYVPEREKEVSAFADAVSEEESEEEFEYGEEGVYFEDDPEEEWHQTDTAAHKATIKKHLANPEFWKKLRGLGKGFELGANFQVSTGNGNCMFNSVSRFISASPACPNGTEKHHAEIRNKACDYIVQERHGELAELLQKRNIVTDEQFKAYI